MKTQSLLKKLLLLVLTLNLLAGCVPSPARPVPVVPTALPVDNPVVLPTPTSAPAAPTLLPAGDKSVSIADAGATIHLEKGQTLKVYLEGNPTTGYTWVLVPASAPILTQVGESEYIPQSKLVGAGGTLHLLFRAEADGTQLFQLAYRRPWEKDVDPLRTFSLTVVVGKGSSQAALPTAVAYPSGGMKGWLTYTNADYGFSFQVPPEWTLAEAKGTMAGHAVLLTPPGGAAQLQVAFKRSSEDAQIGRTGMGSGELTLSGRVVFMGAEIDRQVLVDSGRDMTVRYICPDCMTRGDLVFGFDLDTLGAWSDPAGGLTEAVETQANLVVASVKLAK